MLSAKTLQLINQNQNYRKIKFYRIGPRRDKIKPDLNVLLHIRKGRGLEQKSTYKGSAKSPML
jgi:hypothetical protein